MFIRKYEGKWVVAGSILRLLRKFPACGVMTGTGWEATAVGSPQGGVISPLVANVSLNEFDQFMKERGDRIVRYADDILILCGSKTAAHNARDLAEHYLENDLKLTVNAE